MYLKRLELQGFKSFADKTILEFMPGITTVIGPNGSGKSNIVDGLRWVLGEQSIKSLRGSTSQDIIFAGTQNRHFLGFAEVTIIIDNQDSKLPIEYQEVTVTRKLYRDGESCYFINKVPCRLKDILELFMDTGIGKDGYSIIGQGKIDEILSNKSEDRRHIFEEAAGIVKYRARKEESEKKLEQTKVNLIRINDILTEIESKLEPLKLQSEKAKHFLDLREELKSIEVGLFMYNIDNLKTRLSDVQKTAELIEIQNKDEKEKLDDLQILKDNLKTEIDSITEKIEELQNLGSESGKKEEQLRSEISVCNEKIGNNTENFNRYSKEIDETKERIISLEEEKELKQEKKTSLFENKEKFQKELEIKVREAAELSKNLTGKEVEIEEKKKKVEANTNLKYEKLSEIGAKESNVENFEKRSKVIKEEIRVSVSELDETRIKKEEAVKEFYDLEELRNSNVQKLEQATKVKQENTSKLKDYEDRINRLSYENRINDARLKFLIETEKEKEGYNKTVKSLLIDCEKIQSLGKGMLGVLANIMDVDKEYETAIEMALGATTQNIVTENEEDAKKLINHLRDNSLGRASFLPISSVKGKKMERLIKNNLQGVIGIASDLVKVDKKYEQIILNLLGRTVIVDNMDTAIILAKQNNYSFKIVTLKGDLINPSGAITGGSVNTKTVNILGRKKEIEELTEKVNNLNKEIKNIENEKKNYEDTIKEILEKYENLEKECQEKDIIYATEKQKIDNFTENISKIETKISKLKEEGLQIEKDIIKENQEKGTLKKQIEILEKENEELSKVITEFACLNKDSQRYIDNLNLDITNLKISVSSFDESGISIDEMIERIDKDIENNNVAILNKQNNMEQNEKNNNELKLKISEIEEEIVKMQDDASKSSEKIIELKNLRTNKNTELSNTEKITTEKLELIADLKNQISKLDLKKAKIESELEQIVNKMWEEYEITPNAEIEYKKPDNVNQIIKRVNIIRNDIKELGTINIDSIEEYKKTNERYNFMCDQRFDLEESINKLKKIILDMTGIMKTQFEEQFKVINKNFGETFKELFGGGNAELRLIDENDILNCGIDINVEPPGKKLQNMMLLSGGEKALTAIAILFSILKINPAPICVLDEIEATLDDVNVYRFSEYLKKFAKLTQFLVITHRKGTMEVANTVYGITMEENGISKLLSMKL